MDNELITNILAESMSMDHVTVIEKLSEPKRDEEIAAELNVKETIVRTLLNDLHIKSLVEYERTKNKKTGWYTYLWKKREDKLKEYINGYLQNKLDVLCHRLNEEKNGSTFKCSCSRVSFEMAIDTDFMCPECNGPYIDFDNSKEISRIEIEIAKINNLIRSV
jgi:transcription initiation factor TFIIE subunit alpha